MEKKQASAEGIALRLLSFRDHSREELRRKLIARKISAPEAEEALERLERQGFLDDARYARRLAAHLSKEKLVGNQRILQKLIQKGIHSDCIQEAREEAERDFPSRERIKRLLQRKLKNRVPSELSIQEKTKLGRYFYQQGFSWSEIQEAFHLAGGFSEE